MNFLFLLVVLATPKFYFTDGVTAVVGKKVILASDIKLKLQPHVTKICKQPSSGQRSKILDNFWKGALENEIGQVLLEVEGQKHNIYIGTTAINRTIRAVLKQNKLNSLAELKKKLAAKSHPYLLWRKELRRHLLKRQLISDLVSSRVSVDEEAVKSYYLQKLREGNAEKRVTFQELFIPTKSVTPKIIKEILAEINKKTDFKLIFNKYSPGKSSKMNKVDITPGTYSPQIDRILFPKNMKDAKVNVVHGPLKSEEGVFFIKIIERKESGYLSYAKVKIRLKRELVRKKLQKKERDWIKNLRAKYLVDIHISQPPTDYLCSP
jgi:parvulin-like peptidyl-prolyl isomerase